MKTYTFRVTQDLKAYYEGRISIKAKSEEAALAKLRKMKQGNLEELAKDWEQETDNAEAEGDIEIQNCVEEE